MIKFNIPNSLNANFEGAVINNQIRTTDRLANHFTFGLCPKLLTDIRSLSDASPTEVPSEYAIAQAIDSIKNEAIFKGYNILDGKFIKGLVNILKGVERNTTTFYNFYVEDNSKNRLVIDINPSTGNVRLKFNGRRNDDTYVRVVDFSGVGDIDQLMISYVTDYTDPTWIGLNHGSIHSEFIVPINGWDGNLSDYNYSLKLNNMGQISKYWENTATVICKILTKIITPFNKPGKIFIGASYNNSLQKLDDIFGECNINSSTWSPITYTSKIKKDGYFRLTGPNIIKLHREFNELPTIGEIKISVSYDLVFSKN